MHRAPEQTVLYQPLQRHLKTFIADVESNGDRTVPRFVKKELRDFLDCGLLAKGFLRVRCARYRHDRVVAFSCKHRGFCPSCGGRRMAETAANLSYHVMPEVPVRQWVLPLLRRIRYRLAYDHEACTIALRAFIRTIFADLRRRAKQRHDIVDGKPGGITVIQRFASSLALNLHFHSLVLDGVYTLCEREDGTVRFVPLPAPTDEEIVVLTKRSAVACGEPLSAAILGHSLLDPTATTSEIGLKIQDLACVVARRLYPVTACWLTLPVAV